MKNAILQAVAQFTELKSNKDYKLSALVKLCEDYAEGLKCKNTTLCGGEFYDFLFMFSPTELQAISAGTKTYKDF